MDAEPFSVEEVVRRRWTAVARRRTRRPRSSPHASRHPDVFCSGTVLGEEQQGRTDAEANLGPDLRLSVNGLTLAPSGCPWSVWTKKPDPTGGRCGLALSTPSRTYGDGSAARWRGPAFEADTGVQGRQDQGPPSRSRRRDRRRAGRLDPAPWEREFAANVGRTVTIQGRNLGNRSQTRGNAPAASRRSARSCGNGVPGSSPPAPHGDRNALNVIAPAVCLS